MFESVLHFYLMKIQFLSFYCLKMCVFEALVSARISKRPIFGLE